jgi:urease accessory protein
MKKLAVTATFLLLPGAALAHAGGGVEPGLVAGLMHPLGGADHLLAMVAVGLWAGQIGGRALWALPLGFVTAMLAGGALGMAGLGGLAVEPMILASVIILGAAAALALRLPMPVALAAVALFGAAHGHAHGAEAPAAGLLSYAAGFALVTAGLHGLGIALGAGLARAGTAMGPRALGVLTAAAGLALASR